jgi:hypothetical protein
MFKVPLPEAKTPAKLARLLARSTANDSVRKRSVHGNRSDVLTNSKSVLQREIKQRVITGKSSISTAVELFRKT